MGSYLGIKIYLYMHIKLAIDIVNRDTILYGEL